MNMFGGAGWGRELKRSLNCFSNFKRTVRRATDPSHFYQKVIPCKFIANTPNVRIFSAGYL